jgi:hypothetical protein
MIDANDKATQALDLGEQPKRRGRPATGKALSNADRQRAYRERQKAQRNEKQESNDVPYEEVVTIAQELGERCKKAEARVKELEKQLEQRNEKPKKMKRHRDQPAAVLPEDKTYTLQARTGSGKWQNLVAGIYGEEASRQLDRVIDNKLQGGAKNRQYRLVEDGQV